MHHGEKSWFNRIRMKNIFQIQIYSLTCLLSQNFQLLNLE